MEALSDEDDDLSQVEPETLVPRHRELVAVASDPQEQVRTYIPPVRPVTTVVRSDHQSATTINGQESLSLKQRKKTYHGVAIAIFTKKELFRRKKFILDEKELDYSTSPLSVCYQCLASLHLDVLSSQKWWEEHRLIIIGELSNKRSNVAYGIRNEWLGKHLI